MSTAGKQQLRDVHITNAAASTDRIYFKDRSVIRGKLQPQDFDRIEFPPYQRDWLRHHKLHELMEALSPEGSGVADDLILCVRDSNYSSVGGHKLVIPKARLIVLDGLQRTSAALERQRQNLAVGSFGVKIILDTNEEDERKIFTLLNRTLTPVSHNVHLGNMDDTPVIVALRKMLDENPGLVTVRWKQSHVAGENITARILYETAVILHGRNRANTIEDVQERLEAVTDEFGTAQIASNMKAFFEILRSCFQGTDKEMYMFRHDLIRALAKLFADHHDFWDSRSPQTLQVSKINIGKLNKMKLQTLRSNLEQSSAVGYVYESFVRQINAGRETKLSVK